MRTHRDYAAGKPGHNRAIEKAVGFFIVSCALSLVLPMYLFCIRTVLGAKLVVCGQLRYSIV